MNVNIEYVSVRGKGGEVEVTQVAPGYRIVPSSVTAHIKSLIIIIIRSYRVHIYNIYIYI